MAYRVTPAEVRYRFRTLTDTDIDDDTLNSIGMIPMSEAFVDVILTNSGITYSSLTASQKTLVKGAEIARTCQVIVMDYPDDAWETGPIKFRPTAFSDKQGLVVKLEDEWKRYLTLVGCTIDEIYVSSSGGDDYVPDGDDDTNIDFIDEAEDTFSMWS